VQQLLERGDRSTVLVLQRVLPRPSAIERLRTAFAAVVLDLDDAIYAVPPTRESAGEALKRVARLAVRGSTRASKRRRPLIRALGSVDAVVVGNKVLAEFATRHAARVVEIPTTVEPVEAPPAVRPAPPVLVWMGLPANLPHLEIVRVPLERLAKEIEFTFRIVSSSPWPRPPIPSEFVMWSEPEARRALLTATVGIAPLQDDPWTRGKCALRSIQYGGHALPTVASPVGITDQVVIDGVTGYLATTPDDWERTLRALLTSPPLASRLGEAALAHVRACYSNEVAVSRWSEFLGSL
jgi:hypothetical protein